ncbi:phosphohydrolase [Paenibacillus albidus]|uniref:Phosphohydrolase n=1 Tax=Paenibacillus albidus TaxID=2041023 RepID=A0A917FUP1_9BACL|nr:pyridoxamine 5'-phosphate oxidase family protein [Paenibacillus albidus]GGG04234.1 phosphohydrolase [Paenibacillus albidus]
MTWIDEKQFITSEAELRELVGYPSELVKKKVISHLDENCREFIAKSPLMFISTSDESGKCDVSPRGDAAGFVRLEGDSHLIIPERRGNKRLDSLRNILSNPEIGLVFLIPGLGETLRVNGRAYITKDSGLLQTMAVSGIPPLAGIVVAVEECYLHCAKAFLRSGAWKPETWLESGERPSAARILSAHVQQDGVTAEVIAASLAEGYSKRLY